jgi:hypothetical protein
MRIVYTLGTIVCAVGFARWVMLAQATHSGPNYVMSMALAAGCLIGGMAAAIQAMSE